ncbi:hypothetical protein BCV72DRAFT_201802, partial [Rhizopus microsporus var. microsporus]
KAGIHQIVTAIHKLIETTSLQVRAGTKIYVQLQYLSTFTDQGIFTNIIEQAEQFAAFGFGSAKFQDQEVQEVAIKPSIYNQVLNI